MAPWEAPRVSRVSDMLRIDELFASRWNVPKKQPGGKLGRLTLQTTLAHAFAESLRSRRLLNSA